MGKWVHSWSDRKCETERIKSHESFINSTRDYNVVRVKDSVTAFSYYVLEDKEDFIDFMKKHPDLFKRVSKICKNYINYYHELNSKDIALKLRIQKTCGEDSKLFEYVHSERYKKNIDLSMIVKDLSEIRDTLLQVSEELFYKA